MSWHVSLWVYPIWDSLCLLDFIGYFLFHLGEIFNYNLFKKFLIPFLFLFFWNSYKWNVGAFDIVPEVSETVFSSLNSFYFILLFRSYFHHFILQLTDSFFCFRYSAIDSFSVQFSSATQLCPTLCNSINHSTPGLPTGHITNSRSLLKLMSMKSVMPPSDLILCHPLLLLPMIPPSIRVFSNDMTSKELISNIYK